MMLRPIVAVARLQIALASVGCAARHRAFIDRLHALRRSRQRPAFLSLVLVRLLRPLTKRGAVLLNLALSVFARGALPAAPHLRVARHSEEAPRTVRELMRHRLLERIVLQRSSTQLRERTLSERALPGIDHRSEHRFTQIVRSNRIERIAAYPRLTVALARAASATVPQAAEQPSAPRSDVVRTVFGMQAPSAQSAVRDALPPQELARVTDHVLAQLDRKVLSYRERLGQI